MKHRCVLSLCAGFGVCLFITTGSIAANDVAKQKSSGGQAEIRVDIDEGDIRGDRLAFRG